MADRYQATQLAELRRAAAASSGAAVMGPATTPYGEDAGDELDAARARRGLGEQQGRVEPPALGQGEGLIAELVGELGGTQDDVVPGLHGRECHATALGAHPDPPAVVLTL